MHKHKSPLNVESYIAVADEDTDPDRFAARVHGDSMEPEFPQGCIVVFSPARAVEDGDPCFVRFTNGQTTFKRVYQGDLEGRPVVILRPTNDAHPTYFTPASRVESITRATIVQLGC